VASCVAGGRAFKGTSGSIAGRITPEATRGASPAELYSDNIEVISGIFEDAGQTQSQIYVLGNPQTSYVTNWWTWGVGEGSTSGGNGVVVDSGYEDLGIGPNGGQLIRIWMAFDTSVTDFTGEYRSARWETDNTSSPETGILHHAQYIEIPSGYSSSDNGAPGSLIVNLDATNNSINRESFGIPITFDPAPISVYARFQQKWRDAQHSIFSIGGSGGANLYAQNNNTTSGTFFGRFHDGASQSTCIMSTGDAIDFGDTVELVLTLYSDGHTKGWMSKNGGAWTTGADGATDPTIPGSWGNDNAWLNGSTAISDASGFVELEAFKVVDGSITTTAECDWLRGYKETGIREY